MSRFYKTLIFILFLLILGALFLYFSPASTKEIKIEEKEKLASENSIEPDNKEAVSSENNTNEIIEKNVEPAVKEKTSETTENKNSSDSLKIVSKLVSWGYSKPQNSRTIDTIILHSSYNALDGDKYNLAKLIEEYKEYGVSPHYLIDREGSVYQLVNDKNIAYHAGESKMPDGRTNVNNFSLGIEIMNTESSNPTEKQYQSLTKLISHIKNNHKIKSILGHNQIAPGRKTDPWNFDWKEL
jgi:N-acetyl-anhydromuramyl-L-alanine amidase AmpD